MKDLKSLIWANFSNGIYQILPKDKVILLKSGHDGEIIDPELIDRSESKNELFNLPLISELNIKEEKIMLRIYYKIPIYVKEKFTGELGLINEGMFNTKDLIYIQKE